MKKLVNGIGNALITVLVMLLIAYGWAFFEIKILLKDNPELFGYTFVLVKDNLMITDFYENDIAIVKRNESYSPGDKVLVLSDKDGYILRTVVNVDNISTITKCNTCSKNDEPVDNSAVIGKATAKIAKLGFVIKFFKKKIVLIILGLLGFGCIIASHFIKTAPEVKRKKETK